MSTTRLSPRAATPCLHRLVAAELCIPMQAHEGVNCASTPWRRRFFPPVRCKGFDATSVEAGLTPLGARSVATPRATSRDMGCQGGDSMLHNKFQHSVLMAWPLPARRATHTHKSKKQYRRPKPPPQEHSAQGANILTGWRPGATSKPCALPEGGQTDAPPTPTRG